MIAKPPRDTRSRTPRKSSTSRKSSFAWASLTKRLARALLCELPSGRNLVYRDATLVNGSQQQIHYWGVDQYTRQWKELDTYGGKICENITQAVARDLLADALVSLDTLWPGKLLTTVHDEIIAMVKDDQSGIYWETMLHVMETPPPWAAGMPLSAKGVPTECYRKI